VICVDMPFGMRCGNAKQMRRLYPGLIKELTRVLRVPPSSREQPPRSLSEWQTHTGGRMILMSTLRKILRSSISQERRLHIVAEVQVYHPDSHAVDAPQPPVLAAIDFSVCIGDVGKLRRSTGECVLCD